MIDDTYFMRIALKEAEKAKAYGEVPVGAIVVLGERIIAKAYNLTERLHDVTAHAEMQAITAAANFINGKYLIGCTLYVTLEPCIMCAGALTWSRLDRLVYASKDNKRGFQQANIKLHPKTKIIGGVLENEAKALLQNFFKKKRK